MSNLVFDVIDTACEAADQTFFPPKAALSTRSTTVISTILGYSEYIASIPPKKYKTLTWAGTSEQTALTFNTGQKVADAKYVYGGVGQIDSHGNQISNYTKDFYVPCPTSNFVPLLNGFIPSLQGYCWPGDPLTCPVCQDPPVLKGNVSGNNTFDEPIGLLGVGPGFRTITPTSLSNVGIQGVVTFIEPPATAPTAFVNGLIAPWIILTANHNYTATLTDEYTDAEALANAQVIVSNGATAQNFQRTTGFVTQTTTVIYTISLSNLISGQNYLVTARFRTDKFVQSVKTYPVLATSSTAVIVDSIPLPPAGSSLTIYQVTAAFA